MSSLDVSSGECFMFLEMMNDVNIDKKPWHNLTKKKINLTIRGTYAILFF